MTDILDLIGNTPLVRLERMDAQPCALYVKLENQNPGGSIKDRIALSMIATRGFCRRARTFAAVGTVPTTSRDWS